jgi:hypothetical protein
MNLSWIVSVLMIVQAASRYGIDLPKLLGVKKLLRQSPVWNKLEGKPWFTASFVITFTLAAFAKI